MAWIYLLLAGCFEIGWPVGFKIAQNEATKITGFSVAILCMSVSGYLLYLIPVGVVSSIIGDNSLKMLVVRLGRMKIPNGLVNCIQSLETS